MSTLSFIVQVIPTNLYKHYVEFSITGAGDIYRAKLPRNMEIGDIFNIYRGESTKEGCEWLGDLETSILAHLHNLVPFSKDFDKTAECSLNFYNITAAEYATITAAFGSEGTGIAVHKPTGDMYVFNGGLGILVRKFGTIVTDKPYFNQLF